MRNTINILLSITGAVVAMFLFGAVINTATAHSSHYLLLAAPVLALIVLVVRWLSKRRLHLRMADVILDPAIPGPTLPAPVNNLEREINTAIHRNWLRRRARRNARVTRRRNTDTIIRLVGYPRH